MLVAWMGLHVLDALLTAHLMGMGGVEGNPLLRTVQGQVGAELILVAKVMGAGGVGLLIWRSGRTRLMPLANSLMALVVLYNSTLAASALLT